MATQQDAATIRRGYEAFNKGDLATLSEVIAEDVVWHPAGNNRLSGAKHGRDATFQYFGQLGEAGIRADLHDVMASDQHVAGAHTTVGERGGKRINAHVVILFHMRDGKVAEAWEHMEDTSAWDAYLG